MVLIDQGASGDIRRVDETIVADDARITQVIWNLLKNAIKFSPAGGTISVRARISDEAGAKEFALEVSDTGIGIEPEYIGHVFDAFEQGDRNITRQFGGLGLGLAISKAIAKAHGGELTAASEGAGRGAIFRLTIPVKSPEASAPAPQKPSRRQPQPSSTDTPAHTGNKSSRPLRILLVEDHADSAEVLRRLLKALGHEVISAATFAEALKAAAEAKAGSGLDLVVSDIGLPDGSGLDLMRELSSRYGMRGIALSGYGMESDTAQSKAAGFSRHLIKPLDINLVRSSIEEIAQELAAD